MRKQMQKLHSFTISSVLMAAILAVIFLYLRYPNLPKSPDVISSGIKTQKMEDLSISTVVIPENGALFNETSSYIETFVPLNPENVIIFSASDNPSGVFLSTETKENAKKKISSIGLESEITSSLLKQNIEKKFSTSDVVQFRIGSKTEANILSSFIDELYGVINEKRTLVIITLDFSGADTGTANNQKIFIENLLYDQALEKLPRLGSEIRSMVTLGLYWSKKVNSARFKLTRSGCIETKCFIYGQYNKGERENPSPSTVFTIGGDMMFDRGVNHRYPDNKILDSLVNINTLFEETDLSLINLEGPISPTPIGNELSYSMVFNFPPKTTEALKVLKINAVSLANNHTDNNGLAGLLNTKKVLKENNIKAIGTERAFDDENIAVFAGGYKDISVITINILEVTKDLGPIISQEKSKGNYVIIFPHWGVEYEPEHSRSQEALAHGWVDAGADLIVGTHPHVIQDVEVYKNKAIFYSLGNLLFDQTWSLPTQKGLVLSGIISEKETQIALIPTKSVALKPTILLGEEKREALIRFKNVLARDTEDILILKP